MCAVDSLQTSKVQQIHVKPMRVAQISIHSCTPPKVACCRESQSQHERFCPKSRASPRLSSLTQQQQNEREKEREVVVGEWMYREWERKNEEQVHRVKLHSFSRLELIRQGTNLWEKEEEEERQRDDKERDEEQTIHLNSKYLIQCS